MKYDLSDPFVFRKALRRRYTECFVLGAIFGLEIAAVIYLVLKP